MRPKGTALSILWICLCITGQAQKLTDDQERVILSLLDSAEFYELTAPKRTIELTRRVLADLPEKGYEVMYVRALLHAACSEKMLSHEQVALELCTRAVSIADAVNHPELRIRSNYMKATVFGQYDDTDSSLIYYQKVIELHYPGSSPRFLAGAYSEIGRTYRLLGNSQKAEEYLMKAYHLSRVDEFARLSALAELISLYSESDNPRYLAYLDTLAMSDFYKKASQTSLLAHFDSFLQLENATDEEKERKLREVYQYSLTNSALSNQVGYGWKLYEHLDRLLRYDEAHHLLLELLQKATAAGHGNHIINITQALYENSKKKGDLNDALRYLERHSFLRDSLMTEENIKHISELNIKFETVQKDLEIAQQKARIEQEQRNRNFFIILTALLGALAIVTYVFLRNRVRTARRIAAQEKIIHVQEKEKLLHEREVAELTTSLDTQERERNRIARDLHDGLGSLMSGISAQIETLRSLPQIENAGSPYLAQLRDMVKDATGELRRTSYELMPASLLRQGLEPAMRDLCMNLLVKNGIEPVLEINTDLTALNHEQQLTLYRIIQELLNNIVKHSAAKNVLIQFNNYDHEVSLIVEDDGKGFDVSEKKKTGGLGLGSLQSRVNLLKGFLDIASMPGEGTTVTVNFKMEERQNGRTGEG